MPRRCMMVIDNIRFLVSKSRTRRLLRLGSWKGNDGDRCVDFAGEGRLQHWVNSTTLCCNIRKMEKKWEEIKPTVNGDRITADGLNVKARYVRYFLKTKGTSEKPNYWTCVREFTVNKKVEEHDRIYTNVEALKKTPLTIEGTEVSVRGLK